MHLQPGDIVDIVAPGSGVSHGQISSAQAFLKSWGLNPRVPRGMIKDRGYLAHSDEYRFAFLKDALTNTTSQAVWCLRGGYGSLRLLPYLQKMKKPKTQKMFLGLSDITSLHSFFNQSWQWPTLHAPLLERMGSGDFTTQTARELKTLLFQTSSQTSLVHRSLKPLNEKGRHSQILRGPLVGGNLVVASSSLGTPWQMQVRGKIVFFEEVGERGYRVDRLLQQWLQTGEIQKAKAVVFGDFTGGQESDGRFLWRQALCDFAQGMPRPVLTGVRCGHGKQQRPLILGYPYELHLEDKPFLKTSFVSGWLK